MIRLVLALLLVVGLLTPGIAQSPAPVPYASVASDFGPLDGIGDGRPLVISESMGGSVIGFRLKGLELLHQHVPIIVDGPCISACTLLVDVARANVCLTSRAVMAYHKAAYRDDTGKLLSTFTLFFETPGLNEYLASRGGLPEPDDLLLVDFKEAKRFYRPCHGAK